MITPAHRRRLNVAIHELRRPLQALALSEREPPASRNGLLELARSALADLDVAVNGGEGRAALGLRTASCHELVEATIERWRPAAEPAGGIRLFWDAGDAPVRCDPVRIARALDNLLCNAVEHGGPPLLVTGACVVGRVRITVANGLGESEQTGSADPRRGHGVGVVSEIAAEHRGRFALCRTGTGCVAALELPLDDAGMALAA